MFAEQPYPVKDLHELLAAAGGVLAKAREKS